MPVRLIESVDAWNEAIKSGKTVVVDFSATWCGPCKMIGPIFEEYSAEEEYAAVDFVKVDVDDLQDVAQSCNISAMPTFQVWKNGEKKEEMVGADKKNLKVLLDKAKAL